MIVFSINLCAQKGDTYLTVIKTELQMKTELLKKSLSFLKTLERKQSNGRGEKEDSQLSQPALHSDPVRKECYHDIVYSACSVCLPMVVLIIYYYAMCTIHLSLPLRAIPGNNITSSLPCIVASA